MPSLGGAGEQRGHLCAGRPTAHVLRLPGHLCAGPRFRWRRSGESAVARRFGSGCCSSCPQRRAARRRLTLPLASGAGRGPEALPREAGTRYDAWSLELDRGHLGALRRRVRFRGLCPALDTGE
ncbi:hypothetical protein P7K49_031077 [Saguinus oedipus]|uniref:Uncharacterized protein n=1 Tax=Saguinus oedipus TaxID=9490 RepID=A0ABQ9U566_SAGOE|nr:hypothetical protein P7K49_031077 [Saguinus oedipus]